MKTEKTFSEFKAAGAPMNGAGAASERREGREGSEAQTSGGNPEETWATGDCPEKSETSSERTEGVAAVGMTSESGRAKRNETSCNRTEGAQVEGLGLGTLVSPANVLTSMRIALSGILLLLEPLGMAFCCVYALAGLTDMLDGPIARKTGTVSRVGATLDSAADLIFMATTCVKLLPVYWAQIPTWLLISAVFVFYLKVKNAIAGFVMHKKLITMHALLNRAAGMLLFAFPFACAAIPIPVYGGICVAATFAATVDAFVRMMAKTF